MTLASAVLAFPALQEDSWTPRVGEIVANFGAVARVVAVDPARGLLLRAMPGQAFGPGRDRWHADPAKCRPVR